MWYACMVETNQRSIQMQKNGLNEEREILESLENLSRRMHHIYLLYHYDLLNFAIVDSFDRIQSVAVNIEDYPVQTYNYLLYSLNGYKIFFPDFSSTVLSKSVPQDLRL